MKRTAALLFVLLLAAHTAFAEVTVQDAVSILQGQYNDVNRDSINDEADAQAILDYIAGKTQTEPLAVTLSADRSDLLTGEELNLSVQAQGGFGALGYRFEVVTQSGARVTLLETDSNTAIGGKASITPVTGAEGTLTVTVTDVLGASATADAGSIVIRRIETSENGQYSYYASDDGVVIYAWLDGEADAAVIPQTVGGKTVVAVGPGAFAGMTKLADILLPKTVKRIGRGAFRNCTSLVTMN